MTRRSANPPRSPAAKVLTKLRTIDETADILNVSPRTVRRLIEAGHLRAHRIRGLVRVADADIALFLAEN